MILQGYREDGNNLTNTIELIKNYQAWKADSKDNPDSVDSLKKVVRTFTNFDFLFCAADLNNFREEDKTSIPEIGVHLSYGKILTIFTTSSHANRYAKITKGTYMLLRKDNPKEGSYSSVFQFARSAGVNNVMINGELILSLEDVLQYGGMDNLGIDSEKIVNDDLSVTFYRLPCARTIYDNVLYKYTATWNMDYEKIFWMIGSQLNYFSWFKLGTKKDRDSQIEWYTDEEKMSSERNPFECDLTKESNIAVIQGWNNVMKCVMQIEYTNNSDEVYLKVFEQNYEAYTNSQGTAWAFREHFFDNYMNSVEIVANEEIARREGFSLYKNYIQNKNNIALLTRDNENRINRHIFERHGFNPDLDKNDDGTSIKYPFVFEYARSDDLMNVTVQDMTMAQKLLPYIKRMEKSKEQNEENLVNVFFYNGGECKQSDAVDILSNEYIRNAETKKAADKVAKTAYNITRKIFRSKCNSFECPYKVNRCPKVIAAYLFYLQGINRYEEEMNRWKEVHKDELAKSDSAETKSEEVETVETSDVEETATEVFEEITCPVCGNVWTMNVANIPMGTKYETKCEKCGMQLMRKRV